MQPEDDAAASFTKYLEGLAIREDRRALALLRRGLGKGPATPRMHPFVVPWLRANATALEEEAFYLIASLFAWHPSSWHDESLSRSTNLGASLVRLILRSPNGAPGVERRFTALLDSEAEDLPHHLRQVIGLLRAGDVPVDWAALLRDVRHWGRQSRTVQRNWARAFWQRSPAEGKEGV